MLWLLIFNFLELSYLEFVFTDKDFDNVYAET